MDYEEINLGNVLVTGGAGFIGSNLVELLVHNSDHLVIVDDLSTGRYENIEDLVKHEKISFIKEDISNYEEMNKYFREYNFDYIFHQAALPSVPRSFNDPIATNTANVSGTLNIFRLAQIYKVKKVVYASSSSVYGNTEKLPKVETMRRIPLSPYAASKVACELYGTIFNDNNMVRTTGLRYFNVYGPKQNPNSQYSAVIPLFIKAALLDEPLIIHGDGKQTRDFTFVEDVCKVNYRAVLSTLTDGRIFNVGKGSRISILELAETIIKLTNSNSEIKHVDHRVGDVKHSLADVKSLEIAIGYIPNTSIMDGLQRTIEFFKDQFNL
ncbi:MAG: NAD-dependent epimerase/dehydratase family protein [Candidatus Heimdallarchaeaceae archaeon]